jgi:hypothetical protein
MPATLEGLPAGGRFGREGLQCQGGLEPGGNCRHKRAVTDRPAPPSGETKLSREERLAAKLRENLRRRKEQARSLKGAGETEGATRGDNERDSPDLPKPPASR